MITIILLQILLPIFIVFILTMFLRAVGSFFMISPRMRACQIFSKTSWLPLRYSEQLPVGDEVEFLSEDGVLLRGLFLTSQNKTKHGTILFCHELNGNRSNIAPYADTLLSEGFDIFTFDFRNHGKSDSYLKDYSVPWLTVTDMADVKAAIDYVCSRENDGNIFCNDNSTNYSTDNIIDNTGVRIFGLGKGAMIALCAAGSDSRVKSLVLDAPTTDSHLFKENCWQALVKSVTLPRRLLIRRVLNLSILFLLCQAILYTLKQPFILIHNVWQKCVLGMWYDCQFINIEPIIKNVRQPIMIVHGHIKTTTRPNQIRAFCARMPQKPKLWLTTKSISDDCQKSVADFFMKTT
ncbi:MAG: alpha/beta hydrolase [Planctomycetaceae bacterium]|nr:alpha/beta hydrolase [Planctomycetaceae bacterium]